MPPPLPESDDDSVADDVPTTEQAEAEDAKMGDNAEENEEEKEEDEEEDEEEEEEIYIVERIEEHRSDFEDGKMRYLVKWKGYEARKDRTWEPEANLEGAKDILAEYKNSLVSGSEKSQKKRGRQSGGGSVKPERAEPKAKKSRLTKGAKKSNGDMKQDVNPSPDVGYTEAGDDDWKPPPVKDGSWDPLVQSVDTVVRENADGELWGYLIWNEKSEEGRYYRSKAKLPTIYKACPQRMLHFYEKHLVFSNADEPSKEDDPMKDEAPTT